MENNTEFYKNLDLKNLTYFDEILKENFTEQWGNIIGYENIYLVSTFGSVKSLKFNREKILTQMTTTKGYLRVGLHKNKLFKKEKIAVHRLVAIAFIPNPENKPEVNHKKGIKKDNRVWYLEWNTPSENQDHAYKTGLKISVKGENINTCKLTIKEVLEIRNIGDNMPYTEIAKLYNITPENVSQIIRRKTWRHL